MHPEIELFGLTLKAYSLFAYIAAAAGAVLVWRPLRRAGLSHLRIIVLLVCMCAAFLVGARLWNVAVNPGNYGGSFKWYMLRMAGLSLYGGVLGAGLVLFAFMRAWRRPMMPVLDGFAVPSGIAFCIARIGCFLNGCCAGKETESALGVVFPSKIKTVSIGPFGSMTVAKAVHPTQLYELAGALIGIPLAILLAKKLRLREGARFLIYGAWFCLMRLAVLPFRSLGYGELVTKFIYPALYLLLAALCVLLLILREKKRPGTAPQAEQA